MQPRVLDLKKIQESIETSLLSVMAEILIRNIKGNGVELNSAPQHPIRIGVENFSPRVDKPFDKPRAGQAVAFRTFPCNPAARCLVRFPRVFGFQDRHTAGIHLGVDTADEFTRVDALRPQTRHRALAHVMPVHAVNNDLSGRLNFFNPCVRLLMVWCRQFAMPNRRSAASNTSRRRTSNSIGACGVPIRFISSWCEIAGISNDIINSPIMQCSRINGSVPIYPEAKDSAIIIKITYDFNMSYPPSTASLRTFEARSAS